MPDLPHVDPEMVKSLAQEYLYRPGLEKHNVPEIEATTKEIVGRLSEMYPKHNIMLCHPRHDASKLVNSWKEHFERRVAIRTFGVVVYIRTVGVDVYIFSHGTFILEGDGGYINWCFAGNFKRDAHNPKKVYFYPRAPSCAVSEFGE